MFSDKSNICLRWSFAQTTGDLGSNISQNVFAHGPQHYYVDYSKLQVTVVFVYTESVRRRHPCPEYCSDNSASILVKRTTMYCSDIQGGISTIEIERGMMGQYLTHSVYPPTRLSGWLLLVYNDFDCQCVYHFNRGGIMYSKMVFAIHKIGYMWE